MPAASASPKASACLVRYAGRSLTTGKRAECYANDVIGLHLKAIAAGKTYAPLARRSRRSPPRSPPSSPPTTRRCPSYIVAALMALLSAAGFVHALRTPKNRAVATPEHYVPSLDGRPLVAQS